MAAPLPSTVLSPIAALSFGLRFHPTAEEAISVYLRRWIAGAPVPDAAGIIHHAAVYSHPPADLAAAFPRLPRTHDRYFYSTCRRVPIRGGGYRISRAVAGVSWGSNTNKLVEDAMTGEPLGFVETLKYGKTDWLMEEFHRLPEDAAADGAAERVLCRLYVKGHPKPDSLALAESLAGDRLVLLLGEEQPAAAAAGEELLLQQAAMADAQQRIPPSSPRNRRVMALPVLPEPAPVKIVEKRAAPVAEAPRPKKRTRAAAPAASPVMESPPAATAVPRVALRQLPRPSWCPPPPAGLLSLEPRRPAPAVASAAERSPAAAAAHDELVALMLSRVEEEDGSADDQDLGDFASALETDLETTEEDGGGDAGSRSLEGLAADERGDDDIAMDMDDVFNDLGDEEDDGDGAWKSIPLSDYTDLQYS